MTAEPRWLTKARTYIGVKEVPGLKNSEVIMGWAAYLGGWIKSFYTGDSIPWCGLSAGALAKACGFPLPKNPLSALAWADWGSPLGEAALGCWLVFKRPGGGHVGLYVGEDPTCYHVLGGNQSNAVTIARIEKARCVAMRWPPGEAVPADHTRVWLDAKGAPVSRNEA